MAILKIEPCKTCGNDCYVMASDLERVMDYRDNLPINEPAEIQYFRGVLDALILLAQRPRNERQHD